MNTLNNNDKHCLIKESMKSTQNQPKEKRNPKPFEKH